MKADPMTIREIFNRDVRYQVPLYQRPYSWKQERWSQLWEDICRTYERDQARPGESSTHFLGTLVVQTVPADMRKFGSWLVIDGQQRLTTLQLLLKAAEAVASEADDQVVAGLFSDLTQNNVSRGIGPDDVFKVWPTNVDRVEFRSVMSKRGGNPEGGVFRAFRYFKEQIETWRVAGNSLEDLHAVIETQLPLVAIQLGETDDPQVIFETLNGYGEPLTPADLIKNHLFRQLGKTEDETDVLYENSWRQFDEGFWREVAPNSRDKRNHVDQYFGNWLTMMAEREVQVGTLFREFLDWREDSEMSEEEIIGSLGRYSSAYAFMQDADPKVPAGRFIRRLKQIKNTTFNPLVLWLLGEASAMSQESAEETYAVLESFVMRRAVTKGTSRNYTPLVAEAIKELRGTKSEKYASALSDFFLRQTSAPRRWPTDKDVVAALEGQVYQTIKDRLVPLFETLELTLRARNRADAAFDFTQDLSTEHVLPQDWTEHWPLPLTGNESDDEEVLERRRSRVHVLGNLTLVSSRLNPSMSNGPWASKREALRQASTLLITSGSILFAPSKEAEATVEDWTESWTEDQIDARTKYLIDFALHSWKRPDSGA